MSSVHFAPAILSAFLLVGCSSTEARRETGDAASGRGGNQSAGIPVVTASAEVKTMPVTLEAVGTAEAISTVDIRAQITGQLQQILFEPGQDVRKGEPLFVLDRRPLEAALRQAEAIVAKDEAQLRDAAAGRQRAEDLFNKGILPRSDYDTNIATAAALEATLAADRAQVDQAKLNLQYAAIASPLDGRTGALMTHPGDLVRTNDTQPLVTINQLSPIYVSFAVPARFLMDIRQAEARGSLAAVATLQNAATPGSAHDTPSPAWQPNARGEVTFIDNAVDASTATIKLKATFPNRARDLWPGLFVQVSLQLSRQTGAVVVPSVAVQASQQGQYVYVVKPDRTVELRNVTIDRQQGGETVIANGLKGGEEVVTEGQLRLTPGAHVSTGGHQAQTS
jgi:membrane fusion protein, multidrug efflux system